MRREVHHDQAADQLLGALIDLRDEIMRRMLLVQRLMIAKLRFDPFPSLGRAVDSNRGKAFTAHYRSRFIHPASLLSLLILEGFVAILYTST